MLCLNTLTKKFDGEVVYFSLHFKGVVQAGGKAKHALLVLASTARKQELVKIRVLLTCHFFLISLKPSP